MRFSSLFLFLCTLSCSTTTPSTASEVTPKDNGPVATWEGGTLTQTELDEGVGLELIRMEAEYLNERYQAQRNGLDAIVGEKILEAEVKSRNLADVSALLTAEIDAKIPMPTDEEIETFYRVMARRLGGAPLETVKPQLVAEIARRKKAERFESFMGEMRDKYKVALNLPRPEIPRIPVSVDDDPSIGPEDAPITIVQFAEFQCPYCGRAKETLDKVMEAYAGKVRMVFRDYPLSFHAEAVPAAVAANCSGEQGKYWEMYDILMKNQRALTDADLTRYATELKLDLAKWNTCRADPAQAAEVQADFEDGAKAGVTGTPAFFINGLFLNGAQPFSAFQEIIDQELADS